MATSKPIRAMGIDRPIGVLAILSLLFATSVAWAEPQSGGPEAAPDRSYDCLIEPSLTVKLASPVPGVLEGVFVDRGSTVAAGQVVAQLTSDVEKDSLAIAEARAASTTVIDGRRQQVELLSRKYERAARLQSDRIGSSAQTEEVEVDLRAAASQLAEAEFERELNRLEAVKARRVLEQRTVRSPISGIVVARTLTGGEYASEQAGILEIARMDELNVEVFLPTEDYALVSPGMAATILPAAPVGGRYEAVVSVVDKVFDQRSNTFGLRLSLDNRASGLPAGLRCKAVFRFAAERVSGG